MIKIKTQFAYNWIFCKLTYVEFFQSFKIGKKLLYNNA